MRQQRQRGGRDLDAFVASLAGVERPRFAGALDHGRWLDERLGAFRDKCRGDAAAAATRAWIERENQQRRAAVAEDAGEAAVTAADMLAATRPGVGAGLDVAAGDGYDGGGVVPPIRGRAFDVIREKTAGADAASLRDALVAVDKQLARTGGRLPTDRRAMLRAVDALVREEHELRAGRARRDAAARRTDDYLDRQQREAEEALAACEAGPASCPFGTGRIQ